MNRRTFIKAATVAAVAASPARLDAQAPTRRRIKVGLLGCAHSQFDRALGIVTNSTWQPNAHAHRSFEVLGERGTAVLRPIEPPTLVLDLTRVAGPYTAGSQTIQLPDYQRYVGDFAELAAAVRGAKLLSATLDEELLVQEWLLRACEMI